MKWFEEFVHKYEAGIAHTFAFHGRVHDYVDAANRTFPLRMERAFGQHGVIARYNRSEGLSFATEEMAERVRQLFQIDPHDPQFIAPTRAMGVVEALLRHKPDAGDQYEGRFSIVFLDYAEMLLPNAELAMMSGEDRTLLTTMLRLARDLSIMEAGNTLVLTCEHFGDLNPALRAASSKIEAIPIPAPDHEERKQYVEVLMAQNQVDWEVTAEEMARLTAGLSRMNIEDIRLRAEAESRPVSADLAKSRKDDIVASEFGEVIEILDPTFGFDAIGGHAIVKDFFHKSVIEPMRTGNTRRVPQGIMLLGPPGTGKTALVRAVAREARVNCVVLAMSKIFGQYVGSSERNLERAFECIRSLAPTIVFIDEIDQTVNRGESGDSGVSNRVFQRLMEFTSDTSMRGKVLFVAASNRPDLIDPAFKRAGRFDKKAPMLPPSADERWEILLALAEKDGIHHMLEDEEVIETFKRGTENYTGSDIEAVLTKAIEYRLDDEEATALMPEHLLGALEAIRPAMSEETQHMALLALAEVSDKDLLPPEHRDKLNDRAAIKRELGDEPAQRRGRKLDG